ncbi:MAG: MFS transporter [Burkholderiaceae bacterium]|nr:MFS transporter [Burkholderiaceae bacterium]
MNSMISQELKKILPAILYAVIGSTAFIMMRLSLSLDILSHGGGPKETGIFLAMTTICPTLLSIKYGKLIDRIGTRIPVSVCLCILLLGCILSILFPCEDYGVSLVYVFASILGLGIMGVQLSARYLVGALSSKKNRMTNFAWLALGFSASGILAPLTSGYAIDHLGYSYTYFIASIFVALSLLLFLFSDIPGNQSEKKISNKSTPSNEKRKLHPDLKRILTISAVISMAWDLQAFMLPVYGKFVGLSATQIGWLVGVFYVATLVVRFCIPIITKLLSEWKCLTFTLIIATICYFVIPFCSNYSLLLITVFILGLGLGISNPNILSILFSLADKDRVGEVIGIRTTIANGCHFILPLSYGTMIAVVGASGVFFSLATILGLTAFVSATQISRQKRKDQ